VSQKETQTLSIVTLKRSSDFNIFFIQIFQTRQAIKWLFKLLPHPTSASALPAKNRTSYNR